MGRLFWKFFVAIFLGQVLAIVGVSALVAVQYQMRTEPVLLQAQSEGNPPPKPRLFAPTHRVQGDGSARRRPLPPPLIPVFPLITGLISSLLIAFALAWHFSAPMRRLSGALRQVAKGDLAVRLAPSLGRRRDELGQLARDFDDMAEQLQSSLDGQRRLFHDVSHELRSPLARMQAAIGLARQQPAAPQEALLDRIERESGRIDTLVGELLTLARLESRMLSSSLEAVAMDELIYEVVGDAQLAAEQADCKFALALDAGATVQGDAEWLRRALDNLVLNAIRHSPAGGVLSLRVQRSASTSPEDLPIEVVVLDQGPGVPAEALQQIFQPFYRAASAQGTPGFGLGLAIVRGIVLRHGGQIRADLAPGGGLMIIISLPGQWLAA